jgi:dTDP-glucose pyrophosphorylase
MIVIPMLGMSSRFLNSGYNLPKYQLMLGGVSLFLRSVISFKKYFDTESFVFIVRSDHNAKEFVAKQLQSVDITDYRIIEVQQQTQGQADTVYSYTKDYDSDNSILIFNIDTIRHDFSFPIWRKEVDGFLEVFVGEGDNWSFVKAECGNYVSATTEKKRISNLCSNGLYYFSKLGDFRFAFELNRHDKLLFHKEYYIAPLYNVLIEKGAKIKYVLLNDGITEHCGIPEDYEKLKIKYEGY